MKNNRTKLFLFVLQGAISFCLGACQPRPPETYQGYIEGEYRYLASTGGGALTTLYVQRGQRVHKGEPLFALDADTEAYDWQRLQALLAQQQAQLANLEQGQRPEEIDVLRAQQAQARAQLAQSAANWQRVDGMRAKQLISAEQIDAARTALERDQQRVRETDARLQVAHLSARKKELEAATEAIKSTRALLDQAQWKIAQKQIRAPADGLVHETLFNTAEVVPNGKPVIVFLPEHATKIRFFIPEQVHGHLQPGHKIQLRCDACATGLTAQVTYISDTSEYTPPVLFNRDNRSELMFRAEAMPMDNVQLPIGQPVDVVLAAKP